jgi:hypothetical protein
MVSIDAKKPIGPMAFRMSSGPTLIGFGSVDSPWLVMEADLNKVAKVQFLRNGVVAANFGTEFDNGGVVPAYEAQTHAHIVPPHISELIDKRRAAVDRRCNFLTALLGALHSAAATCDRTFYTLQEPVHSGNYELSWEAGGNPRSKGPSRPLSLNAISVAVNIVKASIEIPRDDGWQLLSLLYVACYQYSMHQFSSSTVTAWSIIEAIQDLFWERLLRDLDVRNAGHTKINNERRKLLTEGREYTASVISQILSLCRVYSDEWLDGINAVRKIRNSIVHELLDPGANGSGEALGMANTLFSKLLECELHFPVSHGLTDPDHPFTFHVIGAPRAKSPGT